LTTGQERLFYSFYQDADNDLLWTQRVSDTPLNTFLKDNLTFSSFKEIITSERKVNLEMKFYYDLAPDYLLVSTSNGGTVEVENLQAKLSSTTATNGVSEIRTKQDVDYRVSQDYLATFVARFTCSGEPGNQFGVEGSNQYVGLLNTDTGLAFGFKGDSGFGVLRRRTSMDETFYEKDVWLDPLDGTGPSGFVIDHTKLNLYRLEYSWHGISPLICKVLNGDGKWITFLIVNFTNLGIESSIGIPKLPLKARVEKTSGNTNVVLWLEAAQASTIGSDSEAGIRSFAVTSTATTLSNTLIPLLSIRNLSTYLTQTNKLDLVPSFITMATEGNSTTQFLLYRGGTVTGGTYNLVSATNSFAEANLAPTSFDVTGAKLEVPFALARTSSQNVKIDDLNIFLAPGETLTLCVLSGSNNITCIAGLKWKEFH
jgi:hypothetical protein